MPEPPFPAGSIVVSCQAGSENPLRGPATMALMARAAVAGGAAGIRVNGPDDVAAVRAAVGVPIIGINKVGERHGVYITPSYESAAEVVAAGADLVAIDGTPRQRPDGSNLLEVVTAVRERLDVPVMADVDSVESGLGARAAGADLVSTTLSGYTVAGEPAGDGPDFELVRKLASMLDCPVVAEGRFWTREEVGAAFHAGAHAVVVGTAITNPMAITRRFVEAIR